MRCGSPSVELGLEPLGELLETLTLVLSLNEVRVWQRNQQLPEYVTTAWIS